jgi:hypothetical protein
LESSSAGAFVQSEACTSCQLSKDNVQCVATGAAKPYLNQIIEKAADMSLDDI